MRLSNCGDSAKRPMRNFGVRRWPILNGRCAAGSVRLRAAAARRALAKSCGRTVERVDAGSGIANRQAVFFWVGQGPIYLGRVWFYLGRMRFYLQRVRFYLRRVRFYLGRVRFHAQHTVERVDAGGERAEP